MPGFDALGRAGQKLWGHRRTGFDLLVTAVEVNDSHGVGIFLRRLFPESRDFVVLRSSTLYRGDNRFGVASFEAGAVSESGAETPGVVAELLRRIDVRRILAVPFYEADFRNAALAKERTGAPLCTYLMDDQNVFASAVSDAAAADLLRVSDLRLAISPEMARAYEEKYQLPFLVLPPVAASAPTLPTFDLDTMHRHCLTMIGNVWRADTLRRLRSLVAGSGLGLDWFGNGSQASWLDAEPEALAADGVRVQGFVPDGELLPRLRQYPALVVPSGSLDEEDDNPAFSRLSLPSRIVFALVGAQIPILVLGHPDTAAGRFVRTLGVGVVTPYESAGFNVAVQALLDPGVQRALRENARRHGPALALPEGGEWIWRSLERGAPATEQFNFLGRRSGRD